MSANKRTATTHRPRKQKTKQASLGDLDKHTRLRHRMDGKTDDGRGCGDDSLSRFLLLCEPDTEIDELGELYETFVDELDGGDDE